MKSTIEICNYTPAFDNSVIHVVLAFTKHVVCVTTVPFGFTFYKNIFHFIYTKKVTIQSFHFSLT